MSRSWSGGSVESVREMASGHVKFGGSSAPGGRGPNALDCCSCGGCGGWPFMGWSVFTFRLGVCVWLEGALSPAPLSLDQSTRSFLPMISWSLRLRTAEAAASASANSANPKPFGRPVSLS
jgi:hypothetical protein